MIPTKKTNHHKHITSISMNTEPVLKRVSWVHKHTGNPVNEILRIPQNRQQIPQELQNAHV